MMFQHYLRVMTTIVDVDEEFEIRFWEDLKKAEAESLDSEAKLLDAKMLEAKNQQTHRHYLSTSSSCCLIRLDQAPHVQEQYRVLF